MGLAAGLAGLAILSACARPTGDFGRAEPDVVHDKVMPAVGRAFATFDGQPVSSLQLSDDELAMRDRVQRFLVARHASDWFYNTAMELQRTRIVSHADAEFKTDRYFNNLMGTRYASSRTRYATVAADITADQMTLPATFKAICAVRETDRRRAIAVAGIASATRREHDAVNARTAENEGHIGWFVRALNYRYRSYNYALDHLLIAAPHPDARRVNTLLNELAIGVGQANTGDFCTPLETSPPAMRQALSAKMQTQAGPTDLNSLPPQ